MRDATACGVLGLAVVLIYSQIGGHRPIAFDDALYLTDNAWVLAGLKWDSLVWAFTNFDSANWHPFTWLSHMADQEMFGEHWGGHMIENMFWHAGNSMLVYTLLRRIGFGRLLGFALAAVFACHPLNVESVAWLSQRKNQLSTFLLLATMIAYLDWRREGRKLTLVLLIAAYVSSLMSKAMGVTLPAVVVIFEGVVAFRDSDGAVFRSYLRAKVWLVGTMKRVLPLAIAAGAMCVATFVAQRSAGAVASLDTLSFSDRVSNATQALGIYLRTFVWPDNLAFFYPLRDSADWSLITIACFFIAGAIAVVVWGSRRLPMATFGLGWFLVSLLPVIGLVQVGSQSHADRYMYVPMIGLLIALGGFVDWLAGRKVIRTGICSLAIAGFAGIMGIKAYAYTMLWQDGETAYRNAIKVGGHSYTMTVSLTATLINLNYLKTAEPFARLAAEKWPDRPLSVANIATLYARYEKYDKAEYWFRRAVQIDPGNLRFQYMLGLTLLHLGRDAEAEEVLQGALKLGGTGSDWRTSDRFAKSVLMRKVPIRQVEIKELIEKAAPREIRADPRQENPAGQNPGDGRGKTGD